MYSAAELLCGLQSECMVDKHLRVAVILLIFSCPTSQAFLKGEIKEAVERGLWVIAKVKNDPLTSALTLPEKIGGRLDSGLTH